MTFLGVAGRSSLELTAAKAPVLMPSGRIVWGHDAEMAIWSLYGVRSQPTTLLITAQGEVLDFWFGGLGSEETRARIDRLVELSG